MRKRSLLMIALLLSSLLVFAAPNVATSDEVTEHEIESAKISLRLATEGMVLLENNGNVLPLEKSGAVALYGAGAVQPVKGGTGSGAVNNRIVYPDGSKVDGISLTTSVLDGFRSAGYTVVNEEFLEKWNQDHLVINTGVLSMGDTIEGDELIDPALAKADAALTDTAIYVIRRNAGEGADRTPTKGDYYLSEDEEANIALLAEEYGKLIVVLNVISVDASWFDESGAEALVLMSNPGMLSGDGSYRS